jgi:glutathione S-transferase
MIVLHHLENSRSQRVLWLLEELGVPYEVKRYARDKTTMLAPPELRKVHPLGKSPVIVDGDVTVAESGAILEYLVQHHGQGSGLLPAMGTPEQRRCSYWMHYAEGSAMPPLLLSLIFSRLPKGPMPFFIRPVVQGIADKVRKGFIAPQLKLHADYIEAELAKHAWFAGGEFTVADIQMSFPLEAGAARGDKASARPRTEAFLEKIHLRPAYQRALAAGGPYELMR